MSFVRTVRGDISPDELGVCYAHEHVFIGPSFTTVQFPEFLLDDIEKQIGELKQFHADGGRSMVDSMPCDSGRNVKALAKISSRSGVHLICPTGLHLPLYYDPGHWSHRYSEEQLAGLFVAEIEEGIDAGDLGGPILETTAHRAGIIKVATGRKWTNRERRILAAASIAHGRTGAPILTHTEEGLLALEQVEFFRQHGVDLAHVCLSHTDRRPDPEFHREILSSGVRVEYDSSFRWKAKGRSDNPTAALIAQLIEEFPDQIMLGMDAARRRYWRCHGGDPGMSFLLTDFSAQLRASGVTDAAWQRMFVSTPASTFSFSTRRDLKR